MTDALDPASFQPLIITIDGLAASGKSSVAQEMAKQLGIAFLSSGLLYRAATWLVLTSPPCNAHVETEVLAVLNTHEVRLIPTPEGNKVTVDQQDMTASLHTDRVDAHVSVVAAHPKVRAWVDYRLRHTSGSFVIEGRDMGSTVFPQASYKFFLSASAEVRATRRAGERQADIATLTAALIARDARDAHQLKPAPDAIHLDTSDLSLAEVVARLMKHIQTNPLASAKGVPHSSH